MRRKLNRFKFLSFAVILSLLLASCGAILDAVTGFEEIPRSSFGDCWRFTTPIEGKLYAQRVLERAIRSEFTDYPFGFIQARVEINSEGELLTPFDKLRKEDLFVLYLQEIKTSATSDAFIEVPYQLESAKSKKIIERGMMKHNLNEMILENELNGETYRLTRCGLK